MPNIYKIPLSNTPQKFSITLAGVEYIMTCRWNSAPGGGWFLDIDDSVTNEPILYNLPLVTGADLLKQYGYLGFGGKLIVYTDGDGDAVPTLDNLGAESNLYFGTE